MSGKIVKLSPAPPNIATVMLTPEMALQLLDANQHNRPLSDAHAHRIAAQITAGKWRFNGDTIKIAENGDILDGQHRCWAISFAKIPVETIVVRGIKREAFATIDTLRKPRGGSDVVALHGTLLHRSIIAAGLAWLVRYRRDVIVTWKARENRVENSDIEEFFIANPGFVDAAAKAARLRGLRSSALLAFGYYVIANRNPDLADRMMDAMYDPTGLSINDPFFRLRGHFMAPQRRRDPVMSIALMFKAANAAAHNENIQSLAWRTQGEHPESFPILNVLPE